MWRSIYDFFLLFIAVSLSAISIKIMDDYFDLEVDSAEGRPNLVALVGQGIVAYALLALLIAAIAEKKATVSLFCAAYAIGMGNDLTFTKLKLPQQWFQVALVLSFSLLVAGGRMSIAAVLLMLAVQIYDNASDGETAAWPLNKLLGATGSVTSALTCAALFLALAMTFSLGLSLVVLVVYVLFSAFEKHGFVCI